MSSDHHTVSHAHWKGDASVGKEPETGTIIVPVRALNIIWGNDSRFWRFQDLPRDETMMIGLKESAWLVQVNWIEVTGKVRKSDLHKEPGSVTKYGIFYIIKFRADAFGWHSVPIKFKFRLTTTSAKQQPQPHYHSTDDNLTIDKEDEKSIILEPYREKQEVWHEIPAGQFSVSNSDGFLEFGMFEVDSAWWKGNMVLAGVKIKPI
ncbi:F-box protein PP2-B11-like [Neltuma alba]|uniref:F-box protein PP2-B11-like n=1 Tax=Neltuma alba TaxID=207710 RepID=UPI0010A565A2|nr:F-box protein PP2-B11-like isoform X2 [Prosopis alba]XP_028784375.1 F-box protein PP2-B11-like [Prosopis alba]